VCTQAGGSWMTVDPPNPNQPPVLACVLPTPTAQP